MTGGQMDKQAERVGLRQERLLTHLERAYSDLLDVISGLDESTLCNQPVTGDWTVKDILLHIIAWNDEFRADIALILKNEHPGCQRVINGGDDFAAWNQEQINARSGWNWTRVLEELERDFNQERALILGLSPADLRQRGITPWKRTALTKPVAPSPSDMDSVATLVSFHWRHINLHVRMLQKWRLGAQ